MTTRQPDADRMRRLKQQRAKANEFIKKARYLIEITGYKLGCGGRI